MTLEDGKGIANQIFGVSSFLTPLITSLLMYKLTQSWVKAAISEVVGDSDMVDRYVGVLNDLFLAQYDLYHEAGQTSRKRKYCILLSISRSLLIKYPRYWSR